MQEIMLLPVDNVHEKNLEARQTKYFERVCVSCICNHVAWGCTHFFHAELLDEGAQSRGGTRGFISKSLNFVLAKSLRERQLLLTLSSLMWSQCGGRTVDGSHFTDKKLFFCTESSSWSLKS